jgi:hypothetical protein
LIAVKRRYRLIVMDAKGSLLECWIEESPEWDLLPSAEDAWRALKSALKKRRPSLRKAVLASDIRNAEILVGKTGFWGNWSTPARVALATAGIAAGYVAIAGATFASKTWPSLLGVLITSVVSAASLAFAAFRRGRGGRIFWESADGS